MKREKKPTLGGFQSSTWFIQPLLVIEKRNRSGECKSSSAYQKIDWLTAAAASRSCFKELFSLAEVWSVSDAGCLSLFPARRDVRVRAVLEGDVADQDPLSRGHWRHESRVQGDKLSFFAQPLCLEIFNVGFFCSWPEKCWKLQPWW